ncbi:alpha-1,2-fucosyltransferase [Desulfovibrio sp.]
MNLIITKIYGGLGNQMFQYAAGRSLSLRYQAPLYLDIEWFDKGQKGLDIRSYQLSIFKNIHAIIQKKHSLLYKYTIECIKKYFISLPIIKEPYFSYWPGFFGITLPATLDGYWQSEKYFADFQNKIRHDFTFPTLPEKGIQFAKQIAQAPESVSVHIRRGDYISNPQTQAVHGNLQQSYYSKALQLIKYAYGKTKLFIFSDDPQWSRQNFDCCGHDAVVVDLDSPDTPHHDMHLMSLCKHHIIANSSFSWWGAWLAKESGITIAPRKWFAQKSFDEYKDIYCKNWIIL